MEQQRWGSSPQIQWEQAEREREKKRKEAQSREKLKKKYQEKARRQLKVRIEVMISILIVAATMGMLISGTTGIYEAQRDYNNLKMSTRDTHKNNEDLRAKIMKYDNIAVLTERAKTLDLVSIGKDNTMVLNLSKNNFKEDDIDSKERWTDVIENKITELYEKLL